MARGTSRREVDKQRKKCCPFVHVYKLALLPSSGIGRRAIPEGDTYSSSHFLSSRSRSRLHISSRAARRTLMHSPASRLSRSSCAPTRGVWLGGGVPLREEIRRPPHLVAIACSLVTLTQPEEQRKLHAIEQFLMGFRTDLENLLASYKSKRAACKRRLSPTLLASGYEPHMR